MAHPPDHPSGPPSGKAPKAGTTAAEAKAELKSAAHEAVETVSAEAAGYADKARKTAADEVKGVASALRTAADELREGSPQERTFSQIADSLADASEAVRDKDLGEVIGSLNAFARRNPLVFLGSAALVGFAATRFVKASAEGHDAAPARTDDADRIVGRGASVAVGADRRNPATPPSTPGENR